jgi:DNA mismatch repair protein MutS
MSKPEKSYIVDDYIDMYIDLVDRRLGEKNIVLLQNGMFYEVYNYRNPQGPDLNILANLLDCQIGRKNKEILEVTRSNYEMIGFPMHSDYKFITKLLNNGYVIAIYNQVENGKKNVERKLSEIISPSTSINYCIEKDNNFLMCVYLEPHKNTKQDFYICAYSIIDISTGENYINETTSRQSDFQYGIERLYQSIKLYNPHEIVIYVTTEYLNGNEWIYNRERLANDLELVADNRAFHYYVDNFDKNIFKLSYQNSFLGEIFKHGMLTPIEYLNLEKYPNAIISYLLLLNFAKNHRTDIIQKISKPQLIESNDTLILTQNSMYQLNIVSDKNSIIGGKNNCLFNILNNCSTAFGRRSFKHRLLNPLIDIKELESSYSNIELLLKDDTYKIITPYLTKILDVERLYRRLALNILSPSELSLMYDSSLTMYNLIIYLQTSYKELVSIDKTVVSSFRRFLDKIEEIFNIEICKSSGKIVDRSIFNNGFYPEIDKVDCEIQTYLDSFNYLALYISNLIDKKGGEEDKVMVSVEKNDRDGRYLELTKKRYENIKSKLHTLKVNIPNSDFNINLDHLECKQNGLTSVKLCGGQITTWNNSLKDRSLKITSLISYEFPKKLEELDVEFHQVLKKITKFIANIDILKCHCVNSITYNLTRPIISSRVENSYLISKELRHPLVECINTKVPFIANDVTLGIDNTDQIICYGYNAVGKTTLQKALCVAIIMAQSGGFVASKYFEYNPYRYIFTRIGNTDNILKNQSSFMVEMCELKYILKHANKNSLVCIDELVASTERFSGISLVCSTILELYKRGVCVFMATHLHEISKMPRITSLERLKIVHLEVRYDANTRSLIYDRKLREGSGSGLYGLEVARFLDLDKNFMDCAFEIRNDLLGNELEVYHSTQSNYNKDIYLHKCSICEYKPILDTDIPLETHHIHFQSCSDSSGNFKELGFHKNVEHNLVVLCKKCHIDVHNNIYNINGYIQTSEGIKLDYTTETVELPPTQKYNNRKKLTPNQVIQVREFIQKNPKLNVKSLLSKLETELDLKIDYKIIKRIRLDIY